MADAITVGRAKTPWHLWAVGVVSLIWHSGGAFDYSATQLKLDFYMSNFTEEQLDYFYGLPWWHDAFWAFGVWGSLVGSVFLLLRSRFAFGAFALSLLGLAGTTSYAVTHDGYAIMGEDAWVFTVVIWVLTLAFTLYAYAMKKRGVLR